MVPDSPLDLVGEVYLKADIYTIKPLPYSKGHARAMGDMYFNGCLWEYSQRGFLKNMMDYAGKSGIEHFASTLSMDLNLEFVMDLVDSLEALDMEVEQYYPEYGNLDENERAMRGIDDLPTSPDDAIRRLEDNKVLFETMEPLLKAYIAVKKEEWRSLKDLSMEDEVNLLLLNIKLDS